MKQYVLFRLKLGWSGEQIEGRIKKDIETRVQFGHWEGDSLLYKGHSQARAMSGTKNKVHRYKKVKNSIAKERVRLTNCCYS